MTTFVFANNVNTTLAGAVSNSATSITLSSSANLPSSIPAGSVLVITLNDVATKKNFEIVYATAIAGATLTVLRGQEGTAALAWLTGDFAYSPPTAGQMLDMGQLGGTNVWTGSNTFNNPVAVGNATIPGQAINLGQAEADFAAINGSSGQVFNVAQAVTPTEAIPLGQLASEFPSSLGANGFKKYPDPNSPTGFFIEQWGNVLLPNRILSTVNFNIAFPNAALIVTGGPGSSLGADNFISIGMEISSNSQFTVMIATQPTGSSGVFWVAKGF